MGSSQKHKEAMSSWGKLLSQKFEVAYYQNPKLCKHCKEPIPYEKKHSGNVFCNHSCSASHSNPNRKKPRNKCLSCGEECKIGANYYCSNQCQRDHYNNQRLSVWLDGGKVAPKRVVKLYLMEQQNNACLHCGIIDWNTKPIVLELEHIDGNGHNDEKTNLCLLCPNCHSQTPTYKARNKGNGRVARRERAKRDYYRALDE